MARGSRFTRSLIFLLAGALAFAGCSDLPTKSTGADFSTPETEAVSSGTESSDTGTQTLATTTPITARRTIGLLGGTVRAGDFTVVIPAGALSGSATITVTQPDPARPVVDLTITPATRNQFRLPVLLVANAQRMDRSLLAVANIGYWNPSTEQWERVTSSVSLTNVTVTAPLWHFSKYRVESGGKAGW